MTAAPYHPPLKYSVVLHGHRTSVSLEPLFWTMLGEAAAGRGQSINALVAQIDAERITAKPAPGLAGAIRVWLVANATGGGIAPTAAAEDPGVPQ